MRTARRNPTVFPYRGKFRLQYQDLLGNQRTLTAQTREEAYQKLALVAGITSRGYLHLPSSQLPSFESWVTNWLELRRMELSPTTIWGYESSSRNYLIPAMGELRLDQVTASHIRQLYLLLQGRHSLTNGTIRRIHALLRGVFRTAVDGGLLLKSPMDSVRQPRLNQKAPDIFTESEMERIWGEVEKLEARAKLRWWMALRLGLRQGEALGLRFTDFDLVRLELHIQRAVNALPGRGIIELPLKSEGSKRTLPIDEVVASWAQEAHKGSSGSYVFPGRGALPMDASADRRQWKKLLVSAGVRELKLHAARHSVASHLVRQGVSARLVQQLLGHSSPSYTLATYVHPDISQLREVLVDSDRPRLSLPGSMSSLGWGPMSGRVSLTR